MRAALVTAWGESPECVEVPRPECPEGYVQVKVIAAGIHRVVRSRASGQHYTSGQLPHRVGTDGVGTTDDGKLVFFSVFQQGGSFAEYVNVSKHAVFPLPTGADPVMTAALVNPALSSWMALKTRCSVTPGFSVCVLGATSTSGRIAVHIAKHMGASKIVGIARNAEALSQMDLDDRIVLEEKTDFTAASQVDVILDYVYGDPAVQLLTAIKPGKPVQYVHIGGLAGLTMSLPGALLRSKDLTIRGSGPGAFSLGEAAKELPNILEAIKDLKVELKEFKLEDVESAWNSNDRSVVLM
jgi:NADPH:quinone reductase-like Zn-dependent oxidoreductase